MRAANNIIANAIAAMTANNIIAIAIAVAIFIMLVLAGVAIAKHESVKKKKAIIANYNKLLIGQNPSVELKQIRANETLEHRIEREIQERDA